MSDIKNDVNKYIYHPRVKEFYDAFNSIDKGGYPSLNYFGINFDNKGISSFKFYFNFFKKMNTSEILKFLPDSTDFFKYYHLWEESHVHALNHTGCTFEIKFKPDMEPIYGFHYRIKASTEAYKLIGYPRLIPFDITKLSTYPGINFEYGKNSTVRKSYYYFDTEEQKKYFADRFGIPFVKECYAVEYSESDNFAKIVLWRFDHTDANLKRPSVFLDYGNKVIAYMRANYGLYNLLDGIYENSDIRASYYFANNLPAGSYDFPYERSENLSFDTLKLFF